MDGEGNMPDMINRMKESSNQLKSKREQYRNIRETDVEDYKLKTSMKIIFTVLFLFPFILSAQPKDAVHPDWQSEIPRVVFPEQDLVRLYEKTWEIAADRVRKGPEDLPASPYLDENCYDDQIWIWDACFMVMFAKYAPIAYPGKQTLENLYYPIHENRPTPLRIHMRDNPPLFAWTEYNNFIFSGDRKQVKHVLEDRQYLQRHFNYFDTIPKGDQNLQISPNPIYRDVFKNEQGQIIGYSWTGRGSGMDNTVRGRDAGGDNQILWIDAISQQALSALYISRLAKAYGDKNLAHAWKKQYEELKKTINERYWDPQDGFYYDIAIQTGEPCRIKTPASFWAMLAEIPDKQQAARMITYLSDPKALGGDYPWTSLSRDDKDHNAESGDYWRGGIWLPMVYMGTKALEKYGYYELADELAEKVIRQQLRTYQNFTPHTIWECYSPSKDEPSTEYGNRARPDFCGWSALGPISLFIENMLGFREINALNQSIRWDLKKKNGTHGLRNLKFGAIVTDIVYDAPTDQIQITTNQPYTLIVNGKKYKIKAGENKIN